MSSSINPNDSLISFSGSSNTNNQLPLLEFNTLLSNFHSNLSITSTFIYDVRINDTVRKKESVDITNIVEYNDDNITTDIHASFALFFINKNLIKVPSKIYRTVSKYTPKHLLYEIHENIDVAIEMCLVFTTQLTSTYFDVKDGSNPKGWKSLKSEYLRNLLSVTPQTYKKVITALEYPLKNGAIIECDYQHIVGEKNRYYRLGDAFIGKGIVSHELKTKEALRVLNKHYFRMLSDSTDNIICKNLINVYGDITLPTKEQILKEAKRLIKFEGGYFTKKQKKLTFLNKHSRDYFKDADKRSFVEDAIEIFEYLTDNGLMIPSAGGEESGGRIVDSFTLMPSWIRNLVKYKGKTLIECDYTALHPNIGIKLYAGNKGFITHGDLALELERDVKDIKIEHLSFFNKEVWQMKQSPLFEYYQKHEPKMLQNIINEKYNSKFKHKITSRMMFALEVEIMTDVVQQLNEEGIYVLYVYDALLCEPKHAEKVLKIMDTTILKYGVKTTAKCSSGRKHNPIVVTLKETEFEDVNTLKQDVVEVKDEIEYFFVPLDELNFSEGLKNRVLDKINAGVQLKYIDAILKFDESTMYIDKVVRINDSINKELKYITHSYLYDIPPLRLS